jgi:glycosyltransferase 2 family protein
MPRPPFGEVTSVPASGRMMSVSGDQADRRPVAGLARFRFIFHGAPGRALRAIFSILLIGTLLATVDFSAMRESLSRVSPGVVALSIASGVAGTTFLAMAWLVLLRAQGIHTSAVRVWWLHMSGLFFASFTPGGLGGDALRYYYLAKGPVSGADSVLAILALRTMSVLGLLVLSSTAWIYLALPPPALFVGVSLTTALAGVTALWMFQPRGSKKSHQLLGFDPAPGAFSAYSERFPIVHAVLSLFRHPQALVASATLAIVGQFFSVASCLPLISAMDLSVSVPTAVSAVALARLAALLPISIHGAGVYEVVLASVLHGAGLDFASGLSLALLDHVIITSIILACGVVYLAGAIRRNSAGAG